MRESSGTAVVAVAWTFCTPANEQERSRMMRRRRRWLQITDDEDDDAMLIRPLVLDARVLLLPVIRIDGRLICCLLWDHRLSSCLIKGQGD